MEKKEKDLKKKKSVKAKKNRAKKEGLFLFLHYCFVFY